MADGPLGINEKEKGMALKSVQAVGTALKSYNLISAAGAYDRQGEAIQLAREFEARQAKDAATGKRATAIRAASEERRRGKVAVSKMRARVGAGGGSMDDPSTARLAGEFAAVAEQNALSRMFVGEQAARGDEDIATLLKYKGEQALAAGRIKGRALRGRGYTTLLELAGGGSLLRKYGDSPYDLDSVSSHRLGETT